MYKALNAVRSRPRNAKSGNIDWHKIGNLCSTAEPGPGGCCKLSYCDIALRHPLSLRYPPSLEYLLIKHTINSNFLFFSFPLATVCIFLSNNSSYLSFPCQHHKSNDYRKHKQPRFSPRWTPHRRCTFIHP